MARTPQKYNNNEIIEENQIKHTFCKDFDYSSNKLLKLKKKTVFLISTENFLNINSCINCINLYYKFKYMLFKTNNFNPTLIEKKKLIKQESNNYYKNILLRFDIYRILFGKNIFIIYEIINYNWKLLKNNCVRTFFFNKLIELTDEDIYEMFNKDLPNFPIELLYLSKSFRISEIIEKIINERLFQRSNFYKIYLNIHNYCLNCKNINSYEHENNCKINELLINKQEYKYKENSLIDYKNTIDLYNYILGYWKNETNNETNNNEEDDDINDYENITILEILTVIINSITINNYVSEDILYLFEEFDNFNELEKALTSLIFIIFLSKLFKKEFLNHNDLFNKIKIEQKVNKNMELDIWIKGMINEYNKIIIEGNITINEGFHIENIPKILNLVEFLTNYNLLIPYLKNAINDCFIEILIFDLLQIFSISSIYQSNNSLELCNKYLKNLEFEKYNLNFKINEKIKFNEIQGKIFYSILKSGTYSIIFNYLLKTYNKEGCNSFKILLPKIFNLIMNNYDSLLINELKIKKYDKKILNTLLNIQSIKCIEKMIFIFDKYFQLFIRRRDLNTLFFMIKGLYEILIKTTEINVSLIINLIFFFKFDYRNNLNSIQFNNKIELDILYENKYSYFFDNFNHMKLQIIELYKQTNELFIKLLINYYFNFKFYNKEMFKMFKNINLKGSFFIKENKEENKEEEKSNLFINYVINELKNNCYINALYNNLLKRIYESYSLRKKKVNNKEIIDCLNITINNKEDSIIQYLKKNNNLKNIIKDNLIINQEKYFLIKIKRKEIKKSESVFSMKYFEKINNILIPESYNLFNYLINEINNFILFYKCIPKIIISIISILSKIDIIEFSIFLNILSILIIIEDENIEKFIIKNFLRVKNIENIINYEIFFTILRKASNSNKFIEEMIYQICLLFSNLEDKNKNLFNIFINELNRIHMKRIYKKIKKELKNQNLKQFLKYNIDELSIISIKQKDNEFIKKNLLNNLKISHSLKYNQNGISSFLKNFNNIEIKNESKMIKLENKQILFEFYETNEKYLNKFKHEYEESLIESDFNEEEYVSSSDISNDINNKEEVNIKSLVHVNLEISSDDINELDNIIYVKNISDVFLNDNNETNCIKTNKKLKKDTLQLIPYNNNIIIPKEESKVIIKQEEVKEVNIRECNSIRKDKESNIETPKYLENKLNKPITITDNIKEEIITDKIKDEIITDNINEENKIKDENNITKNKIEEEFISIIKNLSTNLKEERKEVFPGNYTMTPTPPKRIKLTEESNKLIKISPTLQKILDESKLAPKRETQIINISKKLNEKKQQQYYNSNQIMKKYDSIHFINFILNISINKPPNFFKNTNFFNDFNNFEEFFETYKIFIYIEATYSLISELMNSKPLLSWKFLNYEFPNSESEFFKYKFITLENENIQLNSIILFTKENIIRNKNIQFINKPNVDEDFEDIDKLLNINEYSEYNLFNKNIKTNNREYIFGLVQSCTSLNGKILVMVQTNQNLYFEQNISKMILITSISGTLKELKCLYNLSNYKYIDLLIKPSLLSSNNIIRSNFLDSINDEQIYNTLNIMNKDFYLNNSQKKAIENCLSNNVFTLIKGPPGTGKTSTIIALASLLVNMGLKILISAPSNTAVDHLTRLIINNNKFKDIIITRLGILNSVAEDIRPLMPGYLTNPERIKNKLTDKILTNNYLKKKAQILYKTSNIFTSTLNSTYINQLINTIDVLIVDEVCQAVDTSFFVSLSLNPKKIILIGDPNQLPPTILNGNKSYETTIFSRLSQFQSVNLLNIQYRMHPDISKFPSKYFYEDKLINGISNEIYKDVLKEVDIPYFPCSFINVNGKEIHHINSYYNQIEIDVSFHLITKIYSNSNNKSLTIGIITPYSSQANKLRERVNSLNPDIRNNIQISTVDGFQGQEKDFIIFSTVRTEKIGFLKDERRINVAFTRAKYGLCVLGNKNALKSKVWENFYEYMKIKGKLFKS